MSEYRVVFYPINEKARPSRALPEDEVHVLLDRLHEEKVKSPYELARGRDSQNNLYVIYKPNRKVRSRNEWHENRVLTALARETNDVFLRNVVFSWKGHETEIDGISTRNPELFVEIKRCTMTQARLDFLVEKMSALGAKEMIIVARQFARRLRVPSRVTCFRFREDHVTLRQYYQEQFEPMEQFVSHLKRRHHRFLLASGHWKSQRRRYTITARWDYVDRVRYDIELLFKSKQVPVKIYYSLAWMINPLGEYWGRGHPIERILAGFDVDASHDGPHVVTRDGTCSFCEDDAKKKLKKLLARLKDHGWNHAILRSGKKGFHVYLLDESDVPLEMSPSQMKQCILSWSGLVDSFLSKREEKFDLHRIFKLPQGVDASTGIVISPSKERLVFNDQLLEYA